MWKIVKLTSNVSKRLMIFQKLSDKKNGLLLQAVSLIKTVSTWKTQDKSKKLRGDMCDVLVRLLKHLVRK